ncbi:MAG: hypothetical protein M3167_03820 [Acidobacteriota bacterium]|nr:hypothetical protein [Acidobacteriota bacterium]
MPVTACLFVLVLLATALGLGAGCTGRTAPVTGGPTSSGGSTAPPPAPVVPAPAASPGPSTTRGPALDFARTPPITFFSKRMR